MKLAYISQNQDVFEPGRSLVGCIESLGARPDEARKLLRRFLFNFEDMEKTVESLSGGELNRLQLARAVYQGASLLVLDEPTNHLDIPSREALEEALEDFDGTVLLVSHDRYLLEAVTDRVIEIRDGRFRPYEGSFSEYWRDIGADRSLASLSARGGMGGRAASLARARLNPSDGMSSAGAGVELTARIESLEKDKAAAEKAAEAAIAREDFATGRHMAAEAGRLGRLIDKLYRDLCG
jgi:ATP-binding cassette subfamily F protein 3